MDPSEGAWLRPDPALLRLRQTLLNVVIGVPALLATVVVLVMAGPLEAVATALVSAVALALGLSLVQRSYQAWGYAERQDDLLLRRGVLVRRTTVVPYGRMQFVDVVAGPWDRHFGIARVVLHTAAAATDASIPGLGAEEAAHLRNRLVALGEARAAGV